MKVEPMGLGSSFVMARESGLSALTRSEQSGDGRVPKSAFDLGEILRPFDPVAVHYCKLGVDILFCKK